MSGEGARHCSAVLFLMQVSIIALVRSSALKVEFRASLKISPAVLKVLQAILFMDRVATFRGYTSRKRFGPASAQPGGVFCSSHLLPISFNKV